MPSFGDAQLLARQEFTMHDLKSSIRTSNIGFQHSYEIAGAMSNNTLFNSKSLFLHLSSLSDSVVPALRLNQTDRVEPALS